MIKINKDRRKEKKNGGEDVREMEPLYTAGGK
jgi:hypothetical protein